MPSTVYFAVIIGMSSINMKKSSKPNLVQKLSKPNVLIAVVVSLAVVAVGIYMVATRAAGSSTLTISPTSANTGVGKTVVFTVTENSGTVGVNAVEADLTYDPAKLEFVSISTASSPFTLVARSQGGSGMVYISSASLSPLTGAQTVGTVTFKAKATGSTSVNFGTDSAVIDAQTTTDSLGSTNNATLRIRKK
jgi:hypothetical protein